MVARSIEERKRFHVPGCTIFHGAGFQSDGDASVREARYYQPQDDGYVRCMLCAQYCRIKPSGRGVCGVRENIDGKLYTAVYGLLAAVNTDPIEKKPLYHFYPGSSALSLATVGCNFRCTFCQNWNLSQVSKGRNRRIAGQHADPESIAEAAARQRCRSVSYTYSEPTIFYEWAYDTAKAVTERGMLNAFVTNGYIAPEPLRDIRPYLHGANVDLKAFDDKSYKKVMGAPGVQPVLDTLKLMKQLGIWVEVTTLVVPTRNDSDDVLCAIAGFIAGELGPETPWHISRFHPDYKDTNLPPTSMDALRRAYDIGRQAELRYIYVGNVSMSMLGIDAGSTPCHACGTLLIERFGFQVLRDVVTSDGTCPKCGTSVAGIGMGQDPVLPRAAG